MSPKSNLTSAAILAPATVAAATGQKQKQYKRTSGRRTTRTATWREHLPWWTAATLLLCTRVLGALYAPITDCDETFNYWEPLHFAVSEGSHGLQTWEYAPQFALRSWAYIAPYAATAAGFLRLGLTWRTTFFAVRLVLALICARFELVLASAIHQLDVAVNPNGQSAAVCLLAILVLSPGMFHSAPAFLPSSFAMISTCSALSAWSYSLRTARGARPRPSIGVIASVGVGSLLGWPFAAALGIPYALRFFPPVGSRKTLYLFMRTTVLVATAILLPMLLIDSYMYARPWLLVPINLVVYNVIRNQSSLYGVESWTFYFKNLALNWTPLTLLLALAATFVYLIPGAQRSKDAGWTRGVAWMLVIWLGVFSLQAHKEERFMAPAYPCLAVMAARGAQWVAGQAAVWPRWQRRVISVACVASVVGFAVLRMVGLVVYYAAPVRLDLSLAIPEPSTASTTIVNVCTGNDWFLAPGHFHLPRHARIRFVRQAFDGHLPAEFPAASPPVDKEGMWADRLQRVRNATSAIEHAEFNDKNHVTESRFVPVSSCDYVLGRERIVPHPAATVACAPMLAANLTPMWSRLLYHPFESIGKQVWQHYCLWKV